MADDALEERERQHNEILRQLTAILVRQDVITRQQVEINAAVATTLTRIETLLVRLLRTQDNDRDA